MSMIFFVVVVCMSSKKKERGIKKVKCWDEKECKDRATNRYTEKDTQNHFMYIYLHARSTTIVLRLVGLHARAIRNAKSFASLPELTNITTSNGDSDDDDSVDDGCVVDVVVVDSCVV